MANLFSPTAIETRTPEGTTALAPKTQEEILLVAGLGNPVAADYAAYVRRHTHCRVLAADQHPRFKSERERTWERTEFTTSSLGVVVFLNRRLTENDRRVLDRIFEPADKGNLKFIGVVSTFRIHLGDRDALKSEAYVLGQVEHLNARKVFFRPGHVLSQNSPAQTWIRRLGACFPLVPRRLRSCWIDSDELFAAIESERQAAEPELRRPSERSLSDFGTSRLYTLLGPNSSWRETMGRHRAKGLWPACLTILSSLLSLLQVGHLAALLLDFLARRWPTLKRWNIDTLRPRSFQELLALYNKHNYRYVKVVGYNNGVNHFGHHYSGQTVVSTVHCNRVRRTGKAFSQLKADCGATIRTALDFLAGAGQELYVIPNYSYVCLGTSFFVPIHGSASDFSTVADTIQRVVLYDPVRDRFIAATRNEPAFRDHLYNLEDEVLLLRLCLEVKPKSRYYVHRLDLRDPGSEELLAALQDPQAANVEIRKSRASSDRVTIHKYYKSPDETSSPLLELPRDRLGRLWDRLEENPVTSFLMHAATRYFAWHVELFFSAGDFATFWRSHRGLPLRKLQLRYIRRDGFPHSPFREHDCVSVDLFMLRRHRSKFESYLKRTFTVIRTNPGKHSQ
jgi:hypothetical protein